ncbi:MULTISPECIES: hypothetical protein [Thermoanaerobacterium]|uniref:Phage infection protein n=2 Tax=Thermoanaerobacterium TaxID=28895 RepID=W9EB00_9THEO|nr:MULTISPECIES: hypothetical protein [Thermoanaerobacterium]AFK86969.1 hypothetical protein Tsac_1965 [Thermoanaerobacterium saccharolyticum JW/SL-YS485]ETO39222.1 hypothetical protein V518_0540 [Thermoanaerobacterium aotearoense SCUT27]
MNASFAIYKKAYVNTLKAYQIGQDTLPIIKKAIFYGVKMINTMKDEIIGEDLICNFKLINSIIDMMSTITPKEFINIFPIKKDYKGYKFDTKDYFYTIDYLKTLDLDTSIGDKILDFLWEYVNDDIHEFVVKMLLTMSHLRQMEGQPSIAEEFANMMGIKTYKVYTDNKGKKFLYDSETGKTMPIKDKKSFKIIKSNSVKVG